jgi:hypothetical protein
MEQTAATIVELDHMIDGVRHNRYFVDFNHTPGRRQTDQPTSPSRKTTSVRAPRAPE